jgi:glutathione S-transferase
VGGSHVGGVDLRALSWDNGVMMKLYATTTSPFVRKVLVVAHERGLVDRIEQVILRPSPLEANPELSRANPLNKIPALVLADGTALYDSAVICDYLDSLDGGPVLVPASGAERWRVLRLQALADGVIEAGILAYYERAQRPSVHQWQIWVDGQLQKVRQGLDALDAEAKSFGASVNLGTISAAVAIGWLGFREVTDALAARPNLARWYAEVARRPSMRATEPHG